MRAGTCVASGFSPRAAMRFILSCSSEACRVYSRDELLRFRVQVLFDRPLRQAKQRQQVTSMFETDYEPVVNKREGQQVTSDAVHLVLLQRGLHAPFVRLQPSLPISPHLTMWCHRDQFGFNRQKRLFLKNSLVSKHECGFKMSLVF